MGDNTIWQPQAANHVYSNRNLHTKKMNMDYANISGALFLTYLII